ncbi:MULTISPECIES: hypothetical protein [unclassified Streptomyces]|uniref:hypothetical protein n=1 Tax=unclassified Streptomyces TaxID=2593676 RepID=UPI00363ECBA8
MPRFARTAPAPSPVPAPETWTPEGTIVSQRYRALEGATVLVYTADADRSTARANADRLHETADTHDANAQPAEAWT